MNETIENIKAFLWAKGKTVSTAESITAGHLQTMLTSISGASDFFQGGMTAYQRSVKVNVLHVNDELAKDHNCVHQEVAGQMALGALKLFHSDYAIATCGYAEEFDGKPPHAFIAIADRSGVIHGERVELPAGRIKAQKKTAQLALETFVHLLEKA